MSKELKKINIEVGARIKKLRLERKLTREELSVLVGYTKNFIQEVERGRSGLSSESIKAFSKALNVSADALLFGPVSDNHNDILRKLASVPPTKLKHVLAVIDETIECTK